MHMVSCLATMALPIIYFLLLKLVVGIIHYPHSLILHYITYIIAYRFNGLLYYYTVPFTMQLATVYV